jgi:hypothetical protein
MYTTNEPFTWHAHASYAPYDLVCIGAGVRYIQHMCSHTQPFTTNTLIKANHARVPYIICTCVFVCTGSGCAQHVQAANLGVHELQ